MCSSNTKRIGNASSGVLSSGVHLVVASINTHLSFLLSLIVVPHVLRPHRALSNHALSTGFSHLFFLIDFLNQNDSAVEFMWLLFFATLWLSNHSQALWPPVCPMHMPTSWVRLRAQVCVNIRIRLHIWLTVIDSVFCAPAYLWVYVSCGTEISLSTSCSDVFSCVPAYLELQSSQV